MKNLLRHSPWLALFGVALFFTSPASAQAPAANDVNGPKLLGQGGNALPVNAALPTIWIIGDSTVRNGQGSNPGNGQWGWGAPIEYYFDRAKINVVNRALGGTSSRTFYNSNWPAVLSNVKQGDFLFIQFGHNDKNGDLTGANATIGSLNGIGDETEQVSGRGGQPETVHTFGWYMMQMVEQAKAKGVTPIVCSFIPRKIWADGKVIRANADYFPYADWAGDLAKKENVAYIDLNAITGRKYNALGPDKVEPLFVPTPSEHTHTNWYGAVINAESVIGGLKLLAVDPLAPYFSAIGQSIPAADPAKDPLDGTSTVTSTAAADALYNPANAAPASGAVSPIGIASAAPAGKPSIYIIGDSTANTRSAVILGWGFPFVDYFDSAKVQIFNKAIAARSSRSFIAEGHWDPVLAQLKPGDYVLLQFGHNDTGTPSASRAGDRPSLPGLGEETQDVPLPQGAAVTVGLAPAKDGDAGPAATVHTYGWYMRKYIADAKAKGANVVVLAVTTRDIWSNPNATFGTAVSQTATIVTQTDKYNIADDKVERGLDDGHGHNFRDESREIAKAANVPFVDLTDINADLYEKMGREKTMLFFPQDHTHSSPAGADFNAANIVAGLKALKDSPFTALLSAKGQAVAPADAKYVDNNVPAAVAK
ncbi:MAG TPA: rhamnogalacturonan acetylesterase [Opitutales bacterium]|jgi:lysophospholipase L1-like esterase|nr:rhamnogalacturonan acetylesterase [Opitutales bacterium]